MVTTFGASAASTRSCTSRAQASVIGGGARRAKQRSCGRASKERCCSHTPSRTSQAASESSRVRRQSVGTAIAATRCSTSPARTAKDFSPTCASSGSTRPRPRRRRPPSRTFEPGSSSAREAVRSRRQLPLFRVGLGAYFASGQQWMSPISLDDEVRAIQWIIDHRLEGPFNVVVPEPTTNRAFSDAVGRRAGSTGEAARATHRACRMCSARRWLMSCCSSVNVSCQHASRPQDSNSRTAMRCPQFALPSRSSEIAAIAVDRL